MASEVFSQSVATPSTAFLHGSAFAQESVSAQAHFDRGIDLSAGFDVKGELQGGAGTDAAASIQVSVEGTGGVELRAQLPLTLLSATGAGLVGRLRLAIEANASAGLNLSLTLEELLDLLQADLPGPYGQLLDVLADEFAISAGAWVKAAVTIEVVGEVILSVSLRRGDGLNPGFSASAQYHAGFIYGSGAHFIANFSVPDPRTTLLRLADQVALLVRSQLGGFALVSGRSDVLAAASDVAPLLRPALQLALTCGYDLAASLAAGDGSAPSAPSESLPAFGTGFLDVFRREALLAACGAGEQNLAALLGVGGLADDLTGSGSLADDAAQALGHLADAAQTLSSTDQSDPEPYLAAVLAVIPPVEELLAVAGLDEELGQQISTAAAALYAAACLLHRVVTWRPDGTVDDNAALFAGVTAPAAGDGTVTGSIARQGDTLALTDLVPVVLGTASPDLLALANPDDVVVLQWIADLLGTDLGAAVSTLLVGLAQPNQQTLLQLVPQLVTGMLGTLATDLASQLITPLTDTMTAAGVTGFLTGLVSELVQAVPQVLARVVQGLLGGSDAGRCEEAICGVLLASVSKFLASALTNLITATADNIDDSLNALVSGLNAEGFDYPYATDLRALAGRLGLQVGDVVTILELLTNAVDATKAGLNHSTGDLTKALDLALGLPSGGAALDTILDSDDAPDAAQLPATLGQVALDGIAIAGPIIADAAKLLGLFCYAEMRDGAAAVSVVVMNVVHAMETFLDNLATEIAAAEQALAALVGQIAAAAAALAQRIAAWAAQMKARVDDFSAGVKAFGHQVISAVVPWPFLQAAAEAIFDDLIDAFDGLADLFFGLIDAAAQGLADALDGLAAGLSGSQAGVQVHVAQSVHAASTVDWTARLALVAATAEVPVRRDDFAALCNQLIGADPSYQQLVTAGVTQAQQQAVLNAQRTSAQQQVNDLTSGETAWYADWARQVIPTYTTPAPNLGITFFEPVVEGFSLTLKPPLPVLTDLPGFVYTGQGAAVVDIAVDGADINYLRNENLNIPSRLVVRLNGKQIDLPDDIWIENYPTSTEPFYSQTYRLIFLLCVADAGYGLDEPVERTGRATALNAASGAFARNDRAAAPAPFTSAGFAQRQRLKQAREAADSPKMGGVSASQQYSPRPRPRYLLPVTSQADRGLAPDLDGTLVNAHTGLTNWEIFYGNLPRITVPAGWQRLTITVTNTVANTALGYATFNLAPQDDELAEAVRVRAYEIYQQRERQGRPGTALDDWTAAQNELFLSRIAERAYYHWLAEGQPTYGTADYDWLRAERETWLSIQTGAAR